MKSYGAMKATEFSRKQIGCLYRAAKEGKLKIEKWVMADFYNLADYYGYDDNHTAECQESKVIIILNHFFEGHLDNAQKEIDVYTAQEFELLGNKAKKSIDRELVK